jgi:hypothetical protein
MSVPTNSSRFTLDLKAKEITFFGSPERFCAGRPVPTTLEVTEDGMLVFLFDPKKNSCAQIRYTFDPITKAGSIAYRDATPDPAAPWTHTKSKITLVD